MPVEVSYGKRSLHREKGSLEGQSVLHVQMVFIFRILLSDSVLHGAFI